jgi:hypothetical protein
MVSRRRIERLERKAGFDRPKQCRVCGKYPGLHLIVGTYVDPATQEEYAEPVIPDPCEACGKGPCVIDYSCIQPVLKPPGAPEDQAVFMTEEQASEWHARHDDLALAEWFRDHAGLAHPATVSD